jgi:hypothetical protein
MKDATEKGITPNPRPDQTGHDVNHEGNSGGEAAHDAPAGQPIPLVIDPEFQALIPPLTAEELAQLTANLLADGCIEPLWVWVRDGDGSPPVLLDGHHRHAICRAHGFPFRTASVPGVHTREEAKIWMLRHQVGRRNLPAYVRTELALELTELIATQAKAQQGTRSDLLQNSGTRPSPIHTDREVAKLAGVSHDTVHKVRRLAKEADEPTKAALRRGERSIHAAHKALRPRGASGKAAGAEPSPASPTPATPTFVEPPSRRRMAQRLIDLAAAILHELAAWRRQYPQDAAVHAFGLMEKHVGDLQGYFEQKQEELHEEPATVDTREATADMGARVDTVALGQRE